MKTLATVIALIGFISISLLGVLSIHHQGGHMAECLATQLNGSSAPCPEADPLGFANFHSNALKKISNLIVIDGWVAFYSIAIFTLLIYGMFSSLSISRLHLSRIKFSESELLAPNYLSEITRSFWFSLHENSPSFA